MLSFNNVSKQSTNNTSGNLSFGKPQEEVNQPGVQFKGNLFSNARNDLQEIGAGITTLAGAIFGTDPQARQEIGSLFKTIINDPKQVKLLGDMLLSTYNMTVDEFNSLPLGDVTARVIEGIWEHPITAGFDIATLMSSTGLKVPQKFKQALNIADDQSVRLQAAEQVTRENIRTVNYSNDFLSEIKNIENKYSPDTIGRGMQWIETRGIKNVPTELKPVVQDLLKANATYKRLVSSYGAEILDDVDMATAELIAKESKIPFAEIINDADFKNSDTWKAARNYVVQNDVRPMFHLQPDVRVAIDGFEDLTSNVLERKYGTIDYDTAGKDLFKKASKFTDALNSTKIQNAPKRVNDIIEDYNKANGTNIKKLDTSGGVLGSNLLREINSELKKTMLGSGLYLAANVMSSTLSILNNFDLGAAKRILQKLPKFKLVTLPESKTPILNIISKINNRVSAPLASIDRWLENVAARYIEEYGLENAKLLQSTVPSRVVTTNPLANLFKNLVPFSSYPIAAAGEIAENIRVRPDRSFIYNQIQKVGSEVNQDIQENIEALPEVEPTKAVRQNERGELVQRSTVVTPIQAANMFLLGEYGDAVQVPVLTLINKLVSGEGDPNVFEVDGRMYRMDGTKIKTNQGEFDLLPAISYVGRQILSPVQFYNQVLVPLTTDKYIKDETKLFNRMINDTQYSNLSMQGQRKVTTDATERLGKRMLGTYEYDYYKPYISKRVMKKVSQQKAIQQQIENVLSSDQ